MTTNTKSTPRPVVKTTNPELYVNHTFHMKKAIKYTYNYATVDDYVAENNVVAATNVIMKQKLFLMNLHWYNYSFFLWSGVKSKKRSKIRKDN